METSTTVSRLVDLELGRIEDPATRAILQAIRIDPVLQLRDMPETAPGARHRTWLVARSPYHPIGLAYAESGSTADTPWGYVSVNHLSLGDLGQWSATLEDAYWASDIQRGGPSPHVARSGLVRTPTSLGDLVTVYLENWQTRNPDTFWAWEEVSERAAGPDPIVAWEVIDALVEASDDEQLGYVGAGPLEDFINSFGTREVAAIELRARQNPKFRRCLGHIWLSEGDLPAPILDRIVRASGHRIQPLPRRR